MFKVISHWSLAIGHWVLGGRNGIVALVVLVLIFGLCGGGNVIGGEAGKGTQKVGSSKQKVDKQILNKETVKKGKAKTKPKFANVDASKIKVKEIKQLTTDGEWWKELKWSPDGTKLLASKRKGNMYIIYADGSKKIDLGVEGGDYSWSPDGSKILYTLFEKGVGYYIWVMNADGSNKKKLVRGMYPTWSPDGTKIASRTKGGTGLSIINIDGSNHVNLPMGDIWSDIVWLPSDKIAYTKEEGYNKFNLYTINSNGINEKVLVEDVGFMSLWWLAKQNGKSKVYYTSKDRYGWIIDEDGGNKMKEDSDVDVEDFSPDGTKFVGSIGESDGHAAISNELYIINIDGTGKNQLTNTPDLVEGITFWSPIGDKIAYTDENNENIYVMTLE